MAKDNSNDLNNINETLKEISSKIKGDRPYDFSSLFDFEKMREEQAKEREEKRKEEQIKLQKNQNELKFSQKSATF